MRDADGRSAPRFARRSSADGKERLRRFFERLLRASRAAPGACAPGATAAVERLKQNLVPLLFAAVCAAGIAASSKSGAYYLNEVIARTARNAIIVLSLVVPIVAGLGLNFGIVIGAMAGQVGVLVVENRVGLEAGQAVGPLVGWKGLALAGAISVPVSIVAGILVGACLNRARGREMIAGMILGFFANGLYQLAFLLLAGPVIPLRSERLLLPQGTGLRNTVDLIGIRGALDLLLRLKAKPFGETGPFVIWPVATFLAILAFALLLRWFQRTKLGHDLRAVGQDLHVTEVMGIDVKRKRIEAMVLSTVLGGLGMVVFLQNIGTLNTYQSHEQVGFYAIAALLVGGATVERATIGQALVGTVLFHTLVTVLAVVGQELLGSPQVGEYLRELVAYAIIGVTLAVHAWKKSRESRRNE
jgi:simple sugar transport system permease protein